MADIPVWNDGQSPPPYIEKGKFWKRKAGILHPDTPIDQIRDFESMPGVETEIVKENGKIAIQISTNGITLPEK